VAKRDLDVVVFGATSVTGRRVAAYLGSRAQEVGASWAAAGRDAGRVAAVLAEEGASAPETIVADVDDPGSLAAMAARARVVLNLVGPYTRYGRPVIEACVEGGAHYADLTGEIPFARRVIADFHAAAEAAGVKVIQPCGFESLPPDLAVALAERTARERWGEDLAEVDVTVSVLGLPPGIPRPSDMLSGGTLQSLAEAVGDPDARVIRDPACLIGDEDRAEWVREISPIKIAPWRQDGAAIAPMAPAAFINPAVIHRSAALRQPPTPPFRYREGVAIPGGPVSLPARLAAAGALTSVQAGVRGIASAGTGFRQRTSRFLRRALPSSGFGPRAERLDAWRWRLRAVATTTGGRHVEVVADGEGHPGYLTTARILGEAGLLLAAEGATPESAGCITPALALGTDGIDRFAAAGLRFSLQDAG
jgi:short subunit dehydrogenase-like uncharacterized protein